MKTYKQCKATGKLKYPTEKIANDVRMILWGRDPSVDLSDLHVYKCEFCFAFHVGHESYYKKILDRENVYRVNKS